MDEKSLKLMRFAIRALRIAASTISLVELLRSDWNGGLCAGGAWLLFTQVERRLATLSVDGSDPATATQQQSGNKAGERA